MIISAYESNIENLQHRDMCKEENTLTLSMIQR